VLLADAGLTHAVNDGPLLVAAGVALLVGVIGFLSPCVLPLVPGYLSYVAGLSGTSGTTGTPGTSGTSGTAGANGARVGPSQGRMAVGALLFVLGFTAIFVLEGVLFGSLGAAIRTHTTLIERVLGAVTIVMGIVFLGGIGFLQREFKVHKLPSPGLLGAPLLGAAFGVAWMPCLTPTFGAVYSMSLIEGTAGRGAFLMACYCLGLGVPFVLVALGIGWVGGALGFVRRHMRVVSGVGGLLLMVIGVLLMTGEWTTWMAQLRLTVGPDSGFSV
jgi:cytochrome c-type biogenesis protein